MEEEKERKSLIEFLDEKIQNFKKVLYQLSTEKEQFEELEKNLIVNKSKLFLSLLFLNEDNKETYVQDLMVKCFIPQNDANFKVIGSYFEMLFSVKNELFKVFGDQK